MKNKINNIMRTIAILLCCLSLSNCAGSTYCPAFPEHLVDYFPYKIGDTLFFVNQNRDTLLFLVSDVYKSEETTVTKCGKCRCSLPVYSVEAYDTVRLKRIGMNINTGYPCIEFLYLQRSGYDDWYFDQITALGSCLRFYDKSNKDPFDIKNSALFGEIVILEPEYDKDQQISKVIISKSKGVTEFIDQKYNIQWKNIKK
jgi:hypothetical protein